MIESAIDDKREIAELHCDMAMETFSWVVGKNGVTKIECYGEYGHMAKIPWFAIYVHGILKTRVSGECKTITYAEQPNDT